MFGKFLSPRKRWKRGKREDWNILPPLNAGTPPAASVAPGSAGAQHNNENDVNVEDKYGQTPVLLATVHNSEECLSLLLESGGCPNIKDIAGATPLHYATKKHHLECVKLLLHYQADTKVDFDDTPLAHLTLNCTRTNKTVTTILGILFEHRIDVNNSCQSMKPCCI